MIEHFANLARNKIFDPEVESELERNEFGPFWSNSFWLKKDHYIYHFQLDGKHEDFYAPPLDVFLAAHCSVEDVSLTTRRNAFLLRTPQKTFTLAADSDDTKSRWVNAVTAASLEYKRRLSEVYDRTLDLAAKEADRLAAPFQDKSNDTDPLPPSTANESLNLSNSARNSPRKFG